MSFREQYVCAFGGRRDYYQLPVALAEHGMLDAFITDAYYFGAPQSIERRLPARLVERLRFRQDARIPPERVSCLWGMVPEREARRRAGYADWKIFARLDRKLSLAAAEQARRMRSNLLLYNPYAWEAFTARYDHQPRRVLFQFHPHPDLERQVLLDDSTQHRFFKYSYEEEMGAETDEAVKRRTRDCWRYADMILCASAFTRRSLLEAGADPKKCHIVPYGIDLPDAPVSLPAPGAFHVAFVGTGSQRKGLHHLLLAWRRASLPTSSRLTVVCRSIDAGLIGLIEATPGATLIRGLGGAELQDLFARSTLLAMPSLVEGFGQVYLEALAHGCPVLGTPNTCLPDLGPSPAITLVTPGAIDELAGALELLSCALPDDATVRIEARACAARWPWAQFRSGICAALAR